MSNKFKKFKIKYESMQLNNPDSFLNFFNDAISLLHFTDEDLQNYFGHYISLDLIKGWRKGLLVGNISEIEYAYVTLMIKIGCFSAVYNFCHNERYNEYSNKRTFKKMLRETSLLLGTSYRSLLSKCDISSMEDWIEGGEEPLDSVKSLVYKTLRENLLNKYPKVLE